MLDRFYRWLARKLAFHYANELRKEFQGFYGDFETRVSVLETQSAWERREGSVKTAPGVEYMLFEAEEPVVFQGYLDFSNLLAVDTVTLVLSIRLRKDDEFKPYFVKRLTGEPPSKRVRGEEPLPKMTVFKIPETLGPAGLRLTVEQNAGVSRLLYYLWEKREP